MIPQKTRPRRFEACELGWKQHPATKSVWAAPNDDSSYFCRELIPASRSHRTSASEVEAWTRRDSNRIRYRRRVVFPLHHGPKQNLRLVSIQSIPLTPAKIKG